MTRSAQILPTADCYFCGTTLPLSDSLYVQEDAEILCHICGGLSLTSIEDSEGGYAEAYLIPVKCSHGMPHDEFCSSCDPICATCGHVESDHRGSRCGAAAEQRCLCRRAS